MTEPCRILDICNKTPWCEQRAQNQNVFFGKEIQKDPTKFNASFWPEKKSITQIELSIVSSVLQI